MADFFENVVELFAELQSDGFRVCRSYRSVRFVPLVRAITKDVYCYVFVSDGRSSRADVDVFLWVAPPNNPDDSLDRLCIGYKFLIASKHYIDDAFFLATQQRIRHLYPYLEHLAPAVLDELKNPAFVTLRYTKYLEELALFTYVRSLAEEGVLQAAQVFEVAGQFVQQRISETEFEEQCAAIAAWLLATRGEADAVRCYQNKPELLANALQSQVCVRALTSSTIGRQVVVPPNEE